MPNNPDHDVIFLMAVVMALVLTAYIYYGRPLHIPTSSDRCDSGQMCPIPHHHPERNY